MFIGNDGCDGDGELNSIGDNVNDDDDDVSVSGFWKVIEENDDMILSSNEL